VSILPATLTVLRYFELVTLSEVFCSKYGLKMIEVTYRTGA